MTNLQNSFREIIYQYFDPPYSAIYLSMIVYGFITLVFGVIFRKLTQRHITIIGLYILVIDVFYGEFMDHIWYISFLILFFVAIATYLSYRFIFDKALKWFEVRGINYATTPSERSKLIKDYEERNRT